MSEELISISRQAHALRLGRITLISLDRPAAKGSTALSLRIDVDLPFFVRGARPGEPVVVPRGGFEVRCTCTGGRLAVAVVPLAACDHPFHPYFEADSGALNPACLSVQPDALEVWVREFVACLCYAFAPRALDSENVVDGEAARWYEEKIRRHPDFFHRQFVDHLVSLVPSGRESCPVGQDGKDRWLEPEAERPKRLQILEITSGYGPEQRGVPSDLSFEEGEQSNFHGASRYHLTVVAAASRTLFDEIGWGLTTRGNQVEQGGLLLGQVFEDHERDLIYALVRDVAPARLARGSSTHLQFSTQAWKEMLDSIDRKQERSSNPLKVIGWYHTHPLHLDVFMSGTDQDTQRLLFNEHWQFSMVLNPQRREFKVFHGDQSEPCRGNIVCPSGTEIAGGFRGQISAEGEPALDSGAPRLEGGEEPQAPGPATAPAPAEDRPAPYQQPAAPGRLKWFLALLAAAALLGFLAYWNHLPAGGMGGADGRTRARRAISLLAHGSQERRSEGPDEIVPVRVALAASFLQGLGARGERGTLRILPGADVGGFSGPHARGAQAETRQSGWIRERELGPRSAGYPVTGYLPLRDKPTGSRSPEADAE
ncbi:MAG: hypothetical protein M3O15_03495 [Acidobacteriota bacterium]|nr:hypothetical protein [Acidobacteriota bacterium]